MQISSMWIDSIQCLFWACITRQDFFVPSLCFRTSPKITQFTRQHYTSKISEACLQSLLYIYDFSAEIICNKNALISKGIERYQKPYELASWSQKHNFVKTLTRSLSDSSSNFQKAICCKLNTVSEVKAAAVLQ